MTCLTTIGKYGYVGLILNIHCVNLKVCMLNISEIVFLLHISEIVFLLHIS